MENRKKSFLEEYKYHIVAVVALIVIALGAIGMTLGGSSETVISGNANAVNNSKSLNVKNEMNGE